MRRRGIVTCLCVCLAAVVFSPIASAQFGGPRPEAKPKLIQVQLLAINDFHGNIQPPSGSSGQITTSTGAVDAGGVEYLATHIAQLEATNPNTVVVAAGDLIGASPLISALFHDEPTGGS